MFFTFQQKLLLVAYIIIILSIPVGSYLVSQSQTLKSKAAGPKPTIAPITKVTPTPKTTLSTTLEELVKKTPTPSPDTTSSPTVATSFGPTLSFKVTIEGRPKDNQAGKVFVGIMEGSLSLNPKFLLSFMVDVPASGEYGNLSIAGLTPGNKYTALLKGSIQIATSSAFIMSPAESKLQNGATFNLISGDFNEDNIINTADYSIAQKALGSTPASSNWNASTDLNKDNIINSLDLSLMIKNLGRIGDSGVWTSPIPKSATPSANLSPDSPPVGGPGESTNGHWIWVPN